ncbi:MAG: TolC family protein [Gemmatimonadota bacterium]|nr:MAG: TolC family protein [Gemmatimonadota bacterium]
MKRTTVPAFFVICLLGAPLHAQERAPLTLEEAIDLARNNNPTFLQTLNDLGPANWGVKEANANLFLPNADLAFFTAWQDAGQQRFGAATFPQPAVLLSQYQFALSYTLNGTTLFQPGQRKAERYAVERRIDDADLVLRNQVTSAYLEVLRLEERAVQAERELRRSEEHLRLAEAREEVGAGTRLESMQADVARGRAEVALVQARNAARVAKLRLVQALGVQVPAEQIDLVSEFEIFEPQLDAEAMTNDALSRHPSLVALKADRDAANSSVKVAKASYFPTLSLRASWSGFTREETNSDLSIAQAVGQAEQQANSTILACNQLNDLYNATTTPPPPPFDNCSAFEFTPADSVAIASDILRTNDVFPFDFENEPVQLSAFFSLPLFNGFTRQLQVEQAITRRNDLNHGVRALELQVRADVTEAVHNLETAHQTVILQRENTETAREELRLARERYQLGAGTFLELLDSETLAAQAEVDQIEAVFSFHQSIAMLEAAVGRPLDQSSMR